jgi:hypothetical protein
MSFSEWRCVSGEKIEGRCSNLEKSVDDIDQCAEERFISLMMTRVEADAEHATMEKQVDDLKLEVSHLNRFLERENLVNS